MQATPIVRFGRVISVLICIFLCVSGTVAAESRYQLTVDGKKPQVPLSPLVVNGNTLVPVRTLFEALGYKVTYNNKTKQFTGQRGAKIVRLTIGAQSALLNGKTVRLQMAPVTINKTYVPVRFAGDILGAEVEVNSASKTINIRTADMDLTVKEKLPALNDRGQPIELQHRGNVKLKWWFTSESPYEWYDGFVGPDNTLIFRGFDEFIITNFQGQELAREAYDRSKEEIDVRVREGANGYDITIWKNNERYEWSNIPVYRSDPNADSYTGEQIIISDDMNIQAQIDNQGNLIILTTEGLAAYNTEGKRLWVHREWQTGEGVLSAFETYPGIVTDSANNLYVQYFTGHVVLDAHGETVLAGAGLFLPTIMADDTLLFRNSSYRLENRTLNRLASPHGDGTTGDYRSIDTIGQENWLKRINPATGKTLWTYELSAADRRKGFTLTGFTLIADNNNNAYISITGGGVHSLMPDGRLRFKLNVNNYSFTASQIIPVTDNTFVIVISNQVLFFEYS